VALFEKSYRTALPLGGGLSTGNGVGNGVRVPIQLASSHVAQIVAVEWLSAEIIQDGPIYGISHNVDHPTPTSTRDLMDSPDVWALGTGYGGQRFWIPPGDMFIAWDQAYVIFNGSASGHISSCRIHYRPVRVSPRIYGLIGRRTYREAP